MFICMQKINFIIHFFLKILQRNSKGDIQLLRLHLRGGQGGTNIKNMQIRKRGASCECKGLPIIYWKAYPDLKKVQYRNGQKLWLKVEKNQEQHIKTIIWIKGRALKFHKSGIKFGQKLLCIQKISNNLQLSHSKWA